MLHKVRHGKTVVARSLLRVTWSLIFGLLREMVVVSIWNPGKAEPIFDHCFPDFAVLRAEHFSLAAATLSFVAHSRT
jgi:hypothetical protein